MLKDPIVNVLGRDPRRTHRINANSFQQNAITTVNGWQYVAFYTEGEKGTTGACFVNLSRRQLDPGSALKEVGEWENLIFEDYEQTVDDGHNTISFGVCRGDGTIHLTFDHHCDQLRFRISKLGDGGEPRGDGWNTSLFTITQDTLPGLTHSDLLNEVTYPRFVNIADDLLLTYRIGQAGAGSDVLFRYSSKAHCYTYLGQHLTGVSNNPYINGLDYHLGRVHVSWCYRNFIEFPESTSADAHKQQAGPNGPENNYDLNYAFSDDLGETWKSSDGRVLARVRGSVKPGEGTSIMPSANGIKVFEIPTDSGILNQEAQAADANGGFWALNREKINNEERWMVYHRDPTGNWSKIVVASISQPTEIGTRASICCDRKSNVYLVLPGNSDSTLSIMRGKKDRGYDTFENVWMGDGFDGEPLVDIQRLEISGTLSVFTRTKRETGNVVVLDFNLPVEE